MLRKTGVAEDRRCGRQALRKTGVAEDRCCGRQVLRKTGVAEDRCCGRQVLRETGVAGDRCGSVGGRALGEPHVAWRWGDHGPAGILHMETVAWLVNRAYRCPDLVNVSELPSMYQQVCFAIFCQLPSQQKRERRRVSSSGIGFKRMKLMKFSSSLD